MLELLGDCKICLEKQQHFNNCCVQRSVNQCTQRQTLTNC